MLQLNPQIPVYVEGKGNGRAIGWIDYSEEDHLVWIVGMDQTGEVWLIPNPKVRLQWNFTLGRVANGNGKEREKEGSQKVEGSQGSINDQEKRGVTLPYRSLC